VWEDRQNHSHWISRRYQPSITRGRHSIACTLSTPPYSCRHLMHPGWRLTVTYEIGFRTARLKYLARRPTDRTAGPVWKSKPIEIAIFFKNRIEIDRHWKKWDRNRTSKYGLKDDTTYYLNSHNKTAAITNRNSYQWLILPPMLRLKDMNSLQLYTSSRETSWGPRLSSSTDSSCTAALCCWACIVLFYYKQTNESHSTFTWHGLMTGRRDRRRVNN